MTGARGRARRVVYGALLAATAPSLLGLALLRDSASAAAPLARFALSTSGAAVTGSGAPGAGGGLIITDPGAAAVTGRLDNSPSSYTLAVAGEPGTTLRTLSASSGGPTPPEAQAQYPGGPDASSDSTVGSTTAAAKETTAEASATGVSSPGGTAASATTSLSVDPTGTLPAATVSDDSGTITIAGVLTLSGVHGSAAVTRDAAGLHAAAGVTVASAEVAGQPVSIDDSGVHLLGQSTGGLLPSAPLDVTGLLTQAGLKVSIVAPVMTTTATDALADSGALVVTENTGDLTSGVTSVSSATDSTFYLGHAVATLSIAAAADDVAAPVLPVTPVVPPVASVPTQAATIAAGTPAVPGTPAIPGRTVTTVIGGQPVVAAPGPAAAVPPAVAAPAAYTILGHRLTPRAALSGFAVWELLTLSLATLAALVSRRRTEPEEHLCPCP